MLRQSSLSIRAQVFAAAALLGGVTLVGAGVAYAKAANYDGTWSVLIVTEKGGCDRAYRYPVRISRGSVGYAGEASFNVTGRVIAGGAVTVTVSRGSQSATGTGRLDGNGGGGSWRGGECSGYWTAEKR